jgi:hypothetical protein
MAAVAGGGTRPAERAPALSLADLEAFDARPAGGGRERRFCCPLPACGGKPRDRAHQSLSVNTQTGDWLCFRCGAAGRLVERWRPARELRRERAVRAFRLAPEAMRGHAESAPQLAPLWAATVDLAGTRGAAYLAGRGLPPEIAAGCGVRFAPAWMGRPAVVFPLHGLDQVQVLPAADLAEHDVTDPRSALGEGFDRDGVPVVDLAGHGVAPRAHRHRLPPAQPLDRRRRPAHRRPRG